MTFSCSCVHTSRVVDLTNVTCVPSERWIPAQPRQMKTPKGVDAQVGFLAGQSKQTCRTCTKLAEITCSARGRAMARREARLVQQQEKPRGRAGVRAFKSRHAGDCHQELSTMSQERVFCKRVALDALRTANAGNACAAGWDRMRSDVKQRAVNSIDQH